MGINNDNIEANTLHIAENIGTPSYIYGYNPAQIRRAYNFDNYYTGLGQIIAIVCAFDYPTAREDLEVFSKQFNLPEADFEIIYAREVKPPLDAGWAMESALDIQWAHALAPRAKIFLVLAASNTFIDLFQAVDVANSLKPNVISMSWGGAEFSGETSWDRYFQEKGVTYVAGSGDIGGNTIYPSVSKYVVSVGGTFLPLDEYGNRIGEERAWINTGGGPSIFVPMSFWQKRFGLSSKSGNYRGTTDVAFVADPASGVAIFDSTPYNGLSGWTVIGGTSLSGPCWAAIIALAGQASRLDLKCNVPDDCLKSILSIRSNSRKMINNCREILYKIAGEYGYNENKQYFRDITQGQAGTYFATEGWDFCTGLGTPNVSKLIRKMHYMA